MDLFGSTGGSAWRTQTPGAWMLDSAKAAEGIGRNFGAAFSQASSQKQQGQQFDAKQKQDQGQFNARLALDRDKIIEDKRQWNILHPDPLKPWNAPPIEAPPINTPPPPSAPPSPGYDQQFNLQPQTFGGFGRFADGGRPPVGEPAIVGERGPELFVPDRTGTVIPNDEIGMRYDRNGTGAITPTTPTGWDGGAKPNWMTAAPVQSWRATNALDAIGKVTQARTFDDLTKIQAENPEAGMYPQFQNALRQKSMVLEKGESIMLRQKQAENSSVAARSALDLNKRFNDGLLTLPDEFQVAVRSLGDGARNQDGTPSPAAMGILTAGKQFVETQTAEKAKAAKLVPTRMDSTGKTTFGTPSGGSEESDFSVQTFYNESGKPSFEALVDKNTGKVHASHVVAEHMPPEVKAQQENNKSQIEAVQKELAGHMKTAQSTSADPAGKTSATRSALAARTQLEKLWNERVKLSTNWMNKAGGAATNGAAPEKQAVTPNAPTALPKIQNQADVADVIRQANEAISKGKDPAIIKERLKQMGIQLKE